MKLEQSRRTRFIWMAGAAAAAVILVFWLMNFMGTGSTRIKGKDLWAKNNPKYLLGVRGEDTSICQNLPADSLVIVEALAGKKLENVCNRLLAVAYFKLKEYEKSSDHWGKIDTNAIFLDEALWYHSLSILALKKYEESENTLDSLIKLEGTKKYPSTSTYIEKAKVLKESLPALIEELESK